MKIIVMDRTIKGLVSMVFFSRGVLTFFGFKHVFSVFLWTFRRFRYWKWFSAFFWFWCVWDISKMLLCTIGIILVVDWIYIRMKLWNCSHIGYSGIIWNLWAVTIIIQKGHFHQTFWCKIAAFDWKRVLFPGF